MCSSQKRAVFVQVELALCFVRCPRVRIAHDAARWPFSNRRSSRPAWPPRKQIYDTVSQQAWPTKPTKPTHTSSFRRICMDFIMHPQLHSTFLKQMPEWYKSQTQFLTPSKQVFSCSESSVHLSISSLSIIRQTCETGRFSLTKVSTIFLSESSVNKLWMKIFVNKVSGEFQLTKAALSP